MKRLLRGRTALLAAGLLVTSACSGGEFADLASGPIPAVTAPANSPLPILNVISDRPVVGGEFRVTSDRLPAGETVALMWGTVTGGWVIRDYYYFGGKQYSETTIPLGEFKVDSDGRLDARLEIPEDYGGVHEVVAMIDGEPAAIGGIEVVQSFEMSPLSGPVGTPVELRVTGLGWRTMESTWTVNWDNVEAGFVTAASTRGSAVARFRATGPVGDHFVKVYTGYQGQAYLNYEQSPVAHLPRPEFVFRTTDEEVSGPAAYAEAYPPQPVPESEVHVSGATLALGATQGPVGSQTMLIGEGFPAGASYELVWETFVGSRVSGDGYAASERVLGDVQVGSNGRIESLVTIPDDLGGLHGIALRAGASDIARVHFVIETSIVSMTPTSGPAGTPVTIHLKGVGWTEYDNLYVFTYDNGYMGYVCGFNSQGDVVINFRASGEPGAHLIDLYPGIYQGPSDAPQLLYRLPQLTYADDHPGNKIPALRFRFDVTPPSEPSITD